jgi:acetyl esterase/lipase
MHARRHDEPALLGRIRDVREHSASFGGDPDAVIRQPVVRRREDQECARQIGGAKPPLHQPQREILKLGFPLGGDDRDARSGLQQAASLTKCDLAGAHDKDRPVLQIEKNGIVFQSQIVPNSAAGKWQDEAMRAIAIPLTLLTLAAACLAADPPIPLWPKTAPGESGDIGEEKDTTGPTGGLVAGRRVIRLGNVSVPTMTVYRAPKDKATGASVLVFPGGGYSILALDLEGTEICEWLNSIGVTAILVKYRVPARAGRPRYAAPLEDAQRAIGMVRERAGELAIDPNRIGVLGFSAGGHLAAAASTNFDHRTYDAIDAADTLGCRPDFCLLIYPAYLTVKEEGDKVAPELKITKDSPRTFLVQAEDDGVRVETSLFYYAALRKASVPAEMHLYPTGGHGYGLRPAGKLITTWPQRAEDWLRSQGIIEK